MILAGGQGTRLRPLTLTRPKPVVPLLNRPFLAYQLALLRQHGVTDVILACSYRPEEVRAALGEATGGVRLRYVVEQEPLGTGGGVRNAADLAHGIVFVLNGDVLTDADLTAMRHLHEARGASVTILLTRVSDPRAYGLVETEADGRLRRFREKPGADQPITTDTVNAGIYLLDAELLRRMPADRPVSIEREFFPTLIADGVPCFGWSSPAYWRDIGSPEAYRLAQMDLLAERVRTPLPPPGERRGGAWMAGRLRRAPEARIEGPAVLGEDVVLESGAHVGPAAVLGPGSRVGPRARVERAVLWERVEVGADATLSECVVGTDVTIGARTRVGAGTALAPGTVVPEGARLAG